MRRLGSYTGDYLHLSNEELRKLLKNPNPSGIMMTNSLRHQIRLDIRQVLAWRKAKDPRGWPKGEKPNA